LITGARIKIGYQCAIKLLRCGAQVIATTRFPHDAAYRFAKERDFDKWSMHLHIYGLDMRNITSVERFTEFIKLKYNRLDVIINNAAQTIRRPPKFYSHLIPVEISPMHELPSYLHPLLNHNWNETVKLSILQKFVNFIPSTQCLNIEEKSFTTIDYKKKISGIISNQSENNLLKLKPKSQINISAALTQIPLISEDFNYTDSSFPPNVYDKDSQQVDLRSTNSWELKMEDVTTLEFVEVQLINVTAPFILNNKLKQLMIDTPANEKFIINVSSMEGKFYRPHKSSFHPHTNMSKAALNMMTHTSAVDYAISKIYMNSIDTGWITDEHPEAKMQSDGFQPPLDEIDAMARILDPIFRGINSHEYDFGLFLKDFMPTPW